MKPVAAGSAVAVSAAEGPSQQAGLEAVAQLRLVVVAQKEARP